MKDEKFAFQIRYLNDKYTGQTLKFKDLYTEEPLKVHEFVMAPKDINKLNNFTSEYRNRKGEDWSNYSSLENLDITELTHIVVFDTANGEFAFQDWFNVKERNNLL